MDSDETIIGYTPEGQGDPINEKDLKPLNRLFGEEENAEQQEDFTKTNSNEMFTGFSSGSVFNEPLSDESLESMKKSMGQIPSLPSYHDNKSKVEQDIIDMFMSELMTERHRKRDMGMILSDVGMNLTLNTPQMIDIAMDVLRAKRNELVKLQKEVELKPKTQVSRRKYKKKSPSASTPKYNSN